MPCDLCSAEGDGPPVLARGPYLQNGTSDAITLRWRTSEATASMVSYGPGPDELTSSLTVAGLRTEHEIRIGDLPADARVYYAFGAPGRRLHGGELYFFDTAPPPQSTKPVRVWVIGDAGTGTQSQLDVLAAAQPSLQPPPQVWLMLGDNAYPSGSDDNYQRTVFDVYGDLLRNVVVWPTFGNHDAITSDSAKVSGPYYDMFTLPAAGDAGGVASGTEAYYSFDYGPIHFVCLDSSESDTTTEGPMLGWLQHDLGANTLPWLIAYWHHPPYSHGSHNSDFEQRLIDMRENALPILEAYGVDLVLAGHTHAYERSFYLHGFYGHSQSLAHDMVVNGGDGVPDGDGPYSRSVDGNGAVYVVAGAGGKAGGGLLDHPAMVVSMSKLGSLMVEIEGDTLDARYIGVEPDAVDHFRIEK